MTASRDIFQSLGEQSAETLDMVIARMEARARDPRFVAMRAAYLDLLDLSRARTFLDLGCGTGLDARAAAKRPEFKGVATGVDLSEGMIEAGQRLAAEEGVGERVYLRPGDAAATGLPSGSFDVIVMHTLVSHVTDIPSVLREAGRLLSRDGRLLVFDADFASSAFAYPDAKIARDIEKSLLETFVANPRAMRDLPSIALTCGLQLVDSRSHILADVGKTNFFGAWINNYAPLIKRFGLQPDATVDEWIAEENRANKEGRFFGSLNFHAYLMRRAA